MIKKSTMKTLLSKSKPVIAIILIAVANIVCTRAEKPWQHGRLKVSANHLYIEHEDGTPFFWLGDTGWLLPQRLDRDEAERYLSQTAEEGFNVVQIQVLNGVPSYNRYGSMSHTKDGKLIQTVLPGEYGYWEHLDHLVDLAERNGIYIGMVCIWGGLVKSGMLDEKGAKEYGEFLAQRYGKSPNIIWIMGGDIQGDIKTEIWDTLAHTIKSIDTDHLMTYHPRGRMTSARWFADRDWIDFHMFQSGHRRYGQRTAKDKDYPIPDNTEEDNWMYVDSVRAYTPIKPVIDGEPIYEDIPQGLHDPKEPLWGASDVRRYAYQSVFAGSFGHTYGHNAIMQFARPGTTGAYFADVEKKPWYIAINDPGRMQMKYLKQLILTFPYYERIADNSVILDNGTRYDRLICTRGNDYLMVYNHTGRPMKIDLSKISGKKKHIWIMDPTDGTITDIEETNDGIYEYNPKEGKDLVLIATDADRRYLDR